MIKLKLDWYCEECSKFEAGAPVQTPKVDSRYEYDITVPCKYAGQCAYLCHMLEKRGAGWKKKNTDTCNNYGFLDPLTGPYIPD